MQFPRLRTLSILVAAAGTLAGCSYNDGYGYGGVSVGYGTAGYCDSYYYDCAFRRGYGGYDGYGGYGGNYDPWYGWYGDYYYPGIGIYIYDHGGRRHRWNDTHRRYWEGRRQNWQGRNWNDRRWENWSGYQRRGQSNDGRNWRGRRGN
jgi:hypothetical protein